MSGNITSFLLLNIRDEMKECRRVLQEEFQSDIELISDIHSHLLQRPGKMFRPAIVIVSAKICGCKNIGSMARVAAVIEMLHNATLIHDDVIDNADSRRGQTSVHQKWDRQSSVLMGDYLYAKSLRILLKENSLELMKILGQATVQMCEAEMYQQQMGFNADINEEQYFRLIDGKTAALVSAGCQLGASLSPETNQRLKDAFRNFGKLIGIAFQIIDDLFDYTTDSNRIGKPVGHDLIEGKVTLPLIFTLTQLPSSEREKICKSIETRDITPEIWCHIKTKVKKYGGVDYARTQANRFINEAIELTNIFPQSVFKVSITHLARYVLKRTT